MKGLSPASRRFLVSRRGTSRLGATLLAGVIVCGLWVSRADAAKVPVGQALVILLHNKVVRSSPSVGAAQMTVVAARRPLSGVGTVLPVLGHAAGRGVSGWIEVRLPGRPNSSTGWISTDGTRPSWTPWRLSVNLGKRVLTVYERGRVSRRFPAVVGKPSTPTPSGHFFIEEDLSLSAGAAGAPFALASSARSDVLQDFDGGPGQIAIHGIANLPGALGTASSHGCIRLDADDITWLARRVGPGVPLIIIP
jgi:lipoprotein-anchoring transpeptidase ErfK/SrfK